jgi:hypothetical protein
MHHLVSNAVIPVELGAQDRGLLAISPSVQTGLHLFLGMF